MVFERKLEREVSVLRNRTGERERQGAQHGGDWVAVLRQHPRVRGKLTGLSCGLCQGRQPLQELSGPKQTFKVAESSILKESRRVKNGVAK